MKKLSDKLIMLRRENGWSQEDFAEKLDISRQAISRWENGTALPDAQNILQISRLFGVSADYLLNDDHVGDRDMPVAEEVPAENAPITPKKRFPYWVLIPVALCILLLIWGVTGYVQSISSSTDEVHTHPALQRVKENEVAPTCTEQGYYDEVLYCKECGKEVMRTRIRWGMPAHRFEDQKCTVCGEEQRERD